MKETTLLKWFSLFIRLRDVVPGSHGFIKCATCGAIKHYKEAQAGHYISRAKKATKYNEKNVHAQCVKCNHKLWGGGMQAEMGDYIDKKYGEGTAKTLRELSKVLKSGIHPCDYKHRSDYYRQEVKRIAKEKGVS